MPVEMVEAAAKATHIHDYIKACLISMIPLLMMSKISSRLVKKQLISIARTLMTDPQVLILDEATSMWIP